MFEGIIKTLKKLDRRIKVAIVATGITSFGTRMTNRYDPLYATDLGATPVNLGLLDSLSSAFSTITSIPLGWAVERYSVKKVMLLNTALFLLHLVFMGVAGSWLMLIPAYLISTRLLRMNPLADVIFVTAADPHYRATVMSLSRVIWNALYVFAPLTGAFLVTYFGGMNAQGIRPLYLIEFGLTLFTFFLIARYLPPTLGGLEKKEKTPSNLTSFIQGYREILGEKYVRRWISLRLLQSFATSLPMPFISLWLVESKRASPYIIGMIGSISLIVSLVLQIPAGRLADKIGRKKVYFLFHPAAYLGAVIAILAPTPEYLILAGILGGYAVGAGQGGITGICFPAFITMFWECVPDEKRGRLFGLDGILGLSRIPGSIIGGILWQQGLILEVLLLPMIIELLVVLPLLYTIPETKLVAQ